MLRIGLVCGALMCTQGARAVGLTALTPAQRWGLFEQRVEGLPGATNPFDPEIIAVDATFTLPSGRGMVVPAFWYQGYSRTLSGGTETLTKRGAPEWRLRFTPPEEGPYTVSLVVRTNGQLFGQPFTTNFLASPLAPTAGAAPPQGYVRIANNGRFFETDQGDALPLKGANVCWHGARGTYDYDGWFGAMNQARENYARLWMCPWAFGIETDPGTAVRYRQDHAWQLDYVFQLAEQKGVYLLLCLDYHGMFASEPDYWGGNNYWPTNPYNTAQNGPCPTAGAFFTNAAAMKMYQKRLRYLVARYACSPRLLAWEFFNEIDNDYPYLDAGQVAAWHGTMGTWLRANDPCRHLITTSLTGSSDRPEIWNLPQLDFASFHTYGQEQPAAALPRIIQSFLERYRKPMMIGEFGIDWRGWGRAQDPYYRGWRQGLWAGVLGGSVGTSMSWYWENLHSENLYPAYRALAEFTGPTGWGRGSWTPVSFQTSGDPPVSVGEVVPGGTPFNATLLLDPQWGPKLRGELAVPTPLSAMVAGRALNSFVHGTGHPELRIPFKFQAWLGDAAKLVLHVNSVSDGAIMAVVRDGIEVFRQVLPNKDGKYDVNNEYNQDFSVSLPAGKHVLEIKNRGGDWFCLDWVRLENVLPATYAGGWEPSPIATGLTGERETLLYVVSPEASFPANATSQTIELLRHGSVTVLGLAAGRYQAWWYDPRNANPAGETLGVSDGARMVLPLPEFREDVAGRMRLAKDFGLRSPVRQPGGTFEATLEGEFERTYRIERSDDLRAWSVLVTLTNHAPATAFSDSGAVGASRGYYRAKLTAP